MGIKTLDVGLWQPQPTQTPLSSIADSTPASSSDVEEVIQRIEAAGIDIAPTYEEWCKLGFAIVALLGEQGRSVYHRISRFHSDYTETATDDQYDKCLKSHSSGVTGSTFFYLAQTAGISVNVNFQTAPVASTERVGEVDTTPDESMPSFSASVVGHLPVLLENIAASVSSDEDKDLLILGALTVFSSSLPNIYGVYDQRTLYPNLFLFVTAQASAGKGRLSLCRSLIDPIHKALRDKHEKDMEQYYQEKAEYEDNKRKGIPPQKPGISTLVIPANSSSSSFYQVLNDNGGIGMIFETEGDTLATTFKTDYGNYSDGFRKGFHHETISYSRRANEEFVELKCPRFSVLLSGTPRQVQTLIHDPENGLFSRFMFYSMPLRLVWNNVFAESDGTTLDDQFAGYGNQFYEFYKVLSSMTSRMRFTFTAEQGQRFNEWFSGVQESQYSMLGLDIVASVRRLGPIAFRIAMILTALRIMETGEQSEVIYCSDEDFSNTFSIIEVLLQHTSYVFCQLKTSDVTGDCSSVKQQYISQLPDEFDRQSYLALAIQLNVPPKTADKWVKALVNNKQIVRVSHGHYRKVS